MSALAGLGTAIPMPAFHIVMQAVMCVRLGNQYGNSWSAQDSASKLLNSLSHDRWQYYINECLLGDEIVLGKMLDDRPLLQWVALVAEPKLGDIEAMGQRLRSFVAASIPKKTTAIMRKRETWFETREIRQGNEGDTRT